MNEISHHVAMKTKVQNERYVTQAHQFLGRYFDACYTSAMNDHRIETPEIPALVAKLAALIESADMACDWLCDSHPGSDQRDRGNALRKAVKSLVTDTKPHA